jgi:hypothetical protein
VPTKIAIICDPGKFSAKVQNFFVKNPHPAMPYHCGWTDGENLWDMHTVFRKTTLDRYASRDIYFFDSPVEVTPEYLDSMVGKRKYGYLDVALYPLFQLLGLNWWGTHCSEAVNDDLWMNGYRTPWIPYGAPPSPADLLHWLEK